MAYSHAKVQGIKGQSVQKIENILTDGRTDRPADGGTEAIALPLLLANAVGEKQIVGLSFVTGV